MFVLYFTGSFLLEWRLSAEVVWYIESFIE